MFSISFPPRHTRDSLPRGPERAGRNVCTARIRRSAAELVEAAPGGALRPRPTGDRSQLDVSPPWERNDEDDHGKEATGGTARTAAASRNPGQDAAQRPVVAGTVTHGARPDRPGGPR